MTKLKKHSVVYVPTGEIKSIALETIKALAKNKFLEPKENVYVLTESELEKYTEDCMLSGFQGMNITPDEFIKQNIEL